MAIRKAVKRKLKQSDGINVQRFKSGIGIQTTPGAMFPTKKRGGRKTSRINT